MRRSNLPAGIVIVLAASVGMSLLSCVFTFDLTSCDDYPMPGCPGVATLDGGDGGPDADSGPPSGCIPSENVSAVDNTCGVFVSASLGNDSAAGTKAKPFKTLVAALAKAKGKPVYACGESFTEAVSITTSATLYGGLDCANGWTYSASKKTELTADADAIPLVVSTASTSATVIDFAITSADASKDGGSSIAVLVTQAAASFTRCDVTAGNGKAGLAGAPYSSGGQAGGDGNPGAVACAADQSFGGKGVTNTCGNGDSTSGGGGSSSTGPGLPGGSGLPAGAANGGTIDTTGVCSAGGPGDPGAPGAPGLGAAAIGTLSATGYTSSIGTDGLPGPPGQGGGGGGGSKGETTASVCAQGSGGGASGASGGSGGCGGAGGKAGAAGGASLALVSISATLTFSNVTLKTASGGAGGDGGAGQAGGTGGKGAAGGAGKGSLKPGCAGGAGGTGGPGGKGGGGIGGHSIGIAVSGTAPSLSGATITKGTAGAGGKGDNSGGNTGDGTDGVAAECWDFDGNAACK